MPTIIQFNKRLEALRSERSTFIPLYRELSDYHLAHRGRFLTSDRNKGYKRNTKQINNTSRMSARTLASGMMSGITSPARPWFRLGTGESSLDDVQAVKVWLHEVQQIMYKVFSHSNVYNSLHQLYAELGVFGTAAMGVFHDFENVIWCKPYTVGSYMIGLNAQNISNTFYREYEISVAQCIKQFGIENVSESVKQQWEKGNSEAWVKIIHAVEPNDDRDGISPLARDKAWRSVYYEKSSGTKEGQSKFLRESGFDEFPILTPRWDVTAEDVYATDCPGITTLGDTKALQLAERRKYQAIDKMVNPPLQGPSSLKNKLNGGSVGPNDIIWHEQNSEGLRSIYDFRPDLGALSNEIMTVEGRIKRGFYEDLFLMLANTDRRQITAREVAEKHEEKLLMLGPVLERLHTELLDPLIDRTFNILQQNGVLPVPPPELQNRELNVEYVSVLAQAQRLVATGAVDRLVGFVGQASQLWPEARHKVNINQGINEYAESLGVDPALVRSDEEVAQRVQVEAQQAAQAQAMAAAEQGANIAKTASETDTGGENALGAVMRNAGLA
ncbi:head to tail connecting protein [Vibrio phage 1.021.C._10N.222.51.F9]|nr:head to tail connecting protein [Vibrio phage 1.021.A._10N.222.51.F9]AUR82119.1 head to tail connecting protein [Vibrio phage 1.021.B._10N.222.51.F9]AUR82169.1 head to tail connecting protein [Vibrio phage 1.021.C._10N.222.51.F9]